jgi:hypothetical protein
MRQIHHTLTQSLGYNDLVQGRHASSFHQLDDETFVVPNNQVAMHAASLQRILAVAIS